MKSKKDSKKATILSPENYIRQKSRNLPISKCLVNENWEETRMCHIFIVREHSSGNISFCMYFVDLDCLGIKDTFFQYNKPAELLEEIINNDEVIDFGFIEIPYELAHNIIYSALEYAEEYGFNPHKDFSSITKYFLEEDTDDIPFIEIECGGIYGNPVYINDGMETPAREKQILAQLEKTAGKGNYNLPEDMYDDDDDFFDDDDDDDWDDEEDDWDDDDDDDFFDDDDEDDWDDEDEEEDAERRAIMDELDNLDKEEQKKLYVELSTKEDNFQPSISDIRRMSCLCDLIAIDAVSDEEFEEKLCFLKEKFDISIITIDILSDSSLFTGVTGIEADHLMSLFYDAYENAMNDFKSKKGISKFRKEVGDVPVVDYLEMLRLKKAKSKNYLKKVEECYQKYPDYFLFQLERCTVAATHKGIDLQTIESLFFNQKRTLTTLEADAFFEHYTPVFLMDGATDLALVMTYEHYIESLQYINPFSRNYINVLIRIAKMKKVYEYIESNEES